MTAPDRFLRSARDLLGPRGFTTDPELLEPWLTDWRKRYFGAALGMASPSSTSEVAAFIRLCAAHAVPVVPQGGNSGMSGGATPDASGKSVILSLRRMTAIRSFDESEQQVICEAGVVLQTLHEEAARRKMRFPLTLGGKGSATVGGLISTNAGGTQVLQHGTMRAQVLGLEAVLADGSVFNSLTALRKDNRGFDLKQLLIGSEGTIGIVTAATLRLLPEIGQRTVIWAGLSKIKDAARLLGRARDRAGDALEGFEILPAHSLQAVIAHLPDARPPLSERHEWHALIEFAAKPADAPGLRAMAEDLLIDAFRTGLIEDATIAESEVQAEAFWRLRDSVSSAERAVGPAVQHDISIPVARMAEFIEVASEAVEAEFPGTRAVAFGHLGDGNVHFHVRAPEGVTPENWNRSDAIAITSWVHDFVTRWHGSISAEHGIGQMKLSELGRLGDPVANAMLRAVKHALDPKGILNPGKLVPLAPEDAKP